jgi:hypothetical protein
MDEAEKLSDELAQRGITVPPHEFRGDENAAFVHASRAWIAHYERRRGPGMVAKEFWEFCRREVNRDRDGEHAMAQHQHVLADRFKTRRQEGRG